MFRLIRMILLLTAGVLIGYNEELVSEYMSKATIYIENSDFKNGY